MRINFRKRNIFVGAALAVTLAAIVHADSSSQARACRSILLVLNPAGSELQVLSSNPTSTGQGVVLSYSSTPPGQRQRNRQLMCVFGRNRLGPDDLLVLSSDGRVLGPARLAFIKRFWLVSREAREADSALAEPRSR